MEWKERYFAAHKESHKSKYPKAHADGYYARCNMPKYKTANGLTKIICNFLLWSGHHGERTNNMGRPVQKKIERFNIYAGKMETFKGKIQWQKGAGTKGTSDVKGHVKSPKHKLPFPIYIEVKIGRDKQSDEQKAYEEQVTTTGALYTICTCPEDFFEFYDYCLSL